MHPVSLPGEATVQGRRERKKLATRAAVRDAALSLAIRHGIENVTVEQIAAEADIAVRTFFNHFSSKEEAVISVAAAGAEALITEFRRRPAGESVPEALRQAVFVAMESHDEAGRDYVKTLQLIRRAPSLVPWQMAVLTAQESALADVIAERLGLTEPTARYPLLCAAMALAALRIALDRWLDQVPQHDPPRLDVFRAEIDGAIAQLETGLA
ncbi:TetR family transcriptional regulator [Amycolatopsis sp., V23-08]|uniref:TetR family transcriptional regulator n=1 Tax=Amycolatopsis heterodermiae TaxID=3110235 RepID=A0ABU5R3S9_9PSEU|nr:TetR family transcriptional regulator [Amycolatopsis sp., V23-08]MEA5360866.1 TetR family transcriptional regulator [Amycolatopsis sp., V23-08]